jgi:hypothetical protein
MMPGFGRSYLQGSIIMWNIDEDSSFGRGILIGIIIAQIVEGRSKCSRNTNNNVHFIEGLCIL